MLLIIRLGLWLSGKNTTGVKCSCAWSQSSVTSMCVFMLCWVFTAVVGFLQGGSEGCSPVAVFRSLTAGASLVAEPRLQARGRQELWHTAR